MPEPIGEGELNVQWTCFKREFGLFLTASGKKAESGAVRSAMRIVGQRINDLVDAIQLGDGEDKTDFDVISKKLDVLCAPRSSKHVIRDSFFQLRHAGRSVDQFVTELRKRVKDCDFGALADDLILYVLIRGLDSERFRRRLLETDKLEFNKAIQMCQLMEATAADLQHWTETKVPESVAAVSAKAGCMGGSEKPEEGRGYSKGQAQSTLKGGLRRETLIRDCQRCGYDHKPRQCPAYGQLCHTCQELHHFARKCNARSKDTRLVASSEEKQGEDIPVLLIQVEKVGKKLLAELHCQGKGHKINKLLCQLDSAASCNVLSYQDYCTIGQPKLDRSQTILTMYDGSVKKSVGRCALWVKVTQGLKRLQFEVLNTKHHSLLSLDTCLALGLLQYNSEEVSVVQMAQEMTKEQLFSDYSDVFAGIGLLSGEYDIELDPAIPPVQNRPRKIPHTMKEAVEAKLKSLVQLGVLAEVEEPTDWISNMTAVWKADKKQVRVCLDPRDLNRAVKRNHFNMPTVDDILPCLTKAKVFSLLDAKDGFLHVKLTQRSSYLTTFWGPSCRYRWLRLPFGLSSAPTCNSDSPASQTSAAQLPENIASRIV